MAVDKAMTVRELQAAVEEILPRRAMSKTRPVVVGGVASLAAMAKDVEAQRSALLKAIGPLGKQPLNDKTVKSLEAMRDSFTAMLKAVDGALGAVHHPANAFPDTKGVRAIA